MGRWVQWGAMGLLGLQLLACVQTTVRTVRDPDHAGKRYGSLFVQALDEHTFERAAVIEETYENRLRRSGFQGPLFKYTELFPPTRKVTPEQVEQAVKQRNLAARLEVKSVMSGFNKSYVPRSSSTTSQSDVKNNKDGATVETRTFTTESGGYTVSDPWERFEVRLVDLRTGHVAWMAFTTTHGNSGSGFGGIIESQAGNIAEKLMAEEVLVKASWW
jgi:hypothetical protein